jgi:hypothetical protein
MDVFVKYNHNQNTEVWKSDCQKLNGVPFSFLFFFFFFFGGGGCYHPQPLIICTALVLFFFFLCSFVYASGLFSFPFFFFFQKVRTVEEQVRASAEHKLGVANQSITAGFFDNNTRFILLLHNCYQFSLGLNEKC